MVKHLCCCWVSIYKDFINSQKHWNNLYNILNLFYIYNAKFIKKKTSVYIMQYSFSLCLFLNLFVQGFSMACRFHRQMLFLILNMMSMTWRNTILIFIFKIYFLVVFFSFFKYETMNLQIPCVILHLLRTFLQFYALWTLIGLSIVRVEGKL